MDSSIANYQRGLNPLLQTKRGKVQQRRGALNEQISKQIRLRNGAENLLRVTHDKKIREQITLELSFLDSNLQLLKEELSELNADVQIYQSEKSLTNSTLPHLALGLKETKDVEFLIPFQDVIIEHYFEEISRFEEAIRHFSDLRKAIRTPPRNEKGLALLFQFYNHLCYVERRFYSYHRPLNTYFEWYDAITGIPAIQRSVAFEKGSVIFNIASLYTQLGANEDRSQLSGLQKCLDNYGRAAGCFNYLKDNFSHAPCNDMKCETLTCLIQLFLAQVQETVWQICFNELADKKSFHEAFVLAQESSYVSKMYMETNELLVSIPYKPYLPTAWTGFSAVKRDLFSAMAHFFTAVGVLSMKNITDDVQKRYSIHFIESTPLNQDDHRKSQSINKTWHPSDTNRPPCSDLQRRIMAEIHFREANRLMDECVSTIRLSKVLRKLAGLADCVKKYANLILQAQKENDTKEVQDHADLYEPCAIQARTTYPAVIIPPDFKSFPVEDLFHDLGPLTIFNAKTELSRTKSVELVRTQLCPGFGFSVKGDCPVAISAVDSGGLASICGVQSGDFIVAVGDQDCRWASHDAVVQLIRHAGDRLRLTVASPRQVVATSSNDDASLHSVSTLSSATTSGGGASLARRSLGAALLSPSHNANQSDRPKSWLSSTLPSSFKTQKNKPGEISTPQKVKDPVKETPPPSKCSSPWRVRSFLSLKKNKSESKLHPNNTNNDVKYRI